MRSKDEKVFAGRLDDLPVIPAPDHGGTEKRVVFCPGRFWNGYVMRYFSTKAGEKTPFHTHDWPHYVVVLEGSARALIMGKTWDLSAGSWAYVPANTEHFFENAGVTTLKFLCTVPEHGDPYREDGN